MPHNMWQENCDPVCRNMVSNLPLLFAGGYPTSLDRISESQLEKFIPFMVQCSLGNIQIHNSIEYSEPEWWPEDVPFSIPIVQSTPANRWHEKLKEIVNICYAFHKSGFLLEFCRELANYQPECLRFINNYNSTTSLFERISNKLLVTFRNENMLYDQLPTKNNKKTLLPRVKNAQNVDDNTDERMVEAALFDIYLCDNCEAELYSQDAYKEHEKICIVDDDVIFCGEEILQIDTNLQKQREFMRMFNLCTTTDATDNSNINTKRRNKRNNQSNINNDDNDAADDGNNTNYNNYHSNNINNNNNSNNNNNNNNNKQTIPTNDIALGSTQEKLRRLPRRSRAVIAVSKCPTIAITSPAGQRIYKLSKTVLSKEYLLERLERIERFCLAPPLGDGDQLNRPKFMHRKYNYTNISHTFKRPPGYFYHNYKFPRRQFTQPNRQKALFYLNSTEWKMCKPLSVQLKKLSDDEIALAYQNVRLLNNLMLNEKTIDYIDLCSSEDDEDISDKYESNLYANMQNRYLHDVATTAADVEMIVEKNGQHQLEQPQLQIQQLQQQQQWNSIPLQICSNAQTLSPSVILFSHMSKTTIPLQNYRLMSNDYEHQNEENDYRFLNGANNNLTLSTSGVADKTNPSNELPTFGPDVVLKRIQPSSQTHHQISIDLT